MRVIKLSLLCLALFLSFAANAVLYPLNYEVLIELQIAKDGPTKINIENEKINDIFIHPQGANNKQ